MNTFRAFILDDQDRIIRAEVLDVTSDEEALGAARLFASENDLEVWQGQRKIARLLKSGETHLYSEGPKN